MSRSLLMHGGGSVPAPRPARPDDTSSRAELAIGRLSLVTCHGGEPVLQSCARAALITALAGTGVSAKAHFSKKEYAWAAQLVNYLYRLDPLDEEVRKIKAEALRQMAYVSTGGNDRANLLSQALALEGKVTIPRLNARVAGNIADDDNPAATEPSCRRKPSSPPSRGHGWRVRPPACRVHGGGAGCGKRTTFVAMYRRRGTAASPPARTGLTTP
jgi:hypothetical protein